MAYLTNRQINNLKIAQGKPMKNKIALFGLTDSIIQLEQILKAVTIDERMEIVNSAVPIAHDIYRNIVPKSTKTHYFTSYSKNNKLGIGRDDRKYIYEITPGNLQRSVQILSKVLKKYKWKTGAIGPHYVKDQGKGKLLNSETSYNGFYAHMVLGSAKAWRTKIVMKAKRLSEIPVFKKMSDEGKKVMTKAVRKFWQIA
jgi:hypothetical protein